MISFIVPAYNESSAIRDTIATIRKVATAHDLHDYEIIPIDDGSVDDSKEIIEELAAEDAKIIPVFHDVNKGVGRAVINALKKASKRQFVVVPGDNDVSIASLNLMLNHRLSADLILTVPINKEVRTIGRQIVSATYQILHNIAFGTSVGYLNGPGIWPTQQVKDLHLVSNRFSIASEINVKLLTAGIKFAEVPIYLQADEPTRSTLNLQNFLEVIKIYLMLVVELRLKPDRPVLKPLNRVQIDF